MTNFTKLAVHQAGTHHTNARHWTNYVTTWENIDTLRDHAERRAITNGKYGTLQKKK